MRYTVEYTPRAVGDLKALTPQAANLVYSWVEKNLAGCEDPRSQGKGRKRGGRWRYKVGTYRLVCEIEERRIVILAVTGEAEDAPGPRDRRGNVKRRAPSVFLKSTARQPVKSAALLVVTALLTFAFVSRGAEWLLISQETERLEGFYRAVGGVQEAGFSRARLSIYQPRGKDASEVLRYLEESPYVERLDVRQSVSVLTPDWPNSGNNGGHSGQEILHRYAEDVLFYGTLQGVHKLQSADGYLTGDYRFEFIVDQTVVGTKYMIEEGKLVTLINPRDYTWWTGGTLNRGEKITSYEYVDLTDAAAEMEVGQRYLVRGSLAVGKPSVQRGSSILGSEQAPVLQFKPLVEDGPWSIPVPEGEADFSDPRIARLLEEMKVYDDNQHAERFYLTGDMAALAATPDWVEAHAHLTGGRWLTAEDTELRRPVCVVWGTGEADDLFHVGDTIAVTLRDVTAPDNWSGPEYADRVNWTPYYSGYLCMEEDLARLDEIGETSVTMELEVVGTYSYVDYVGPQVGGAYIPSSLLPETFTHCAEPLEANMISFSLTGPEVQEAFLAESQEALGALGFQAVMPENGWANFKEAAEPMKRSSLYSALVFAAVLAAGLAIVTAVYFYMRRKELPIARAMGLPARTCVGQIAAPVLLLAGAPGIALGSLLGWWWTARNAGDTLSALSEFGTIDPSALPGEYLAAMAGIAFVLLAGMCLLSAVLTARRPVLELLQGAARAAVAEVAAGTAEPAPFTAPVPAAEAVHVRPAAGRGEKLGLRTGLTFRFVWRQASRARLRTALTVLLAAGFTVGLAAIQLAIAGSQDRIDWLYEHTPVEAELVRTGTYQGASIRRDTVQALKDSGYISDFYLEASASAASGCAPYQDSHSSGAIHIAGGESLRRSLLGFESERTFLSAAGSGANVTITYHEGWNGSLFAQSWTGAYDPEDGSTLFPVIVPKDVYDLYSLAPGERITLFSRSVRPFEVAGYYEGACGGDSPDPLLLPLSACQTLCGGRVSYSKAHVTLDPSLNRQLDAFEAALTEISGRQGFATLRAVIWDEELRQAVAPLEGSIQLMRVLYPVTLVLSLLCAAGVAALLIMNSAKEAAILRVQGTTKLRTRVILGLQQTLTCAAGLVMGLVGVLLYVGSARPDMLDAAAAGSALCALGYLLAAAAGSAASASVVTGKHPLEMLQVKE